jgi:hypothetical protein
MEELKCRTSTQYAILPYPVTIFAHSSNENRSRSACDQGHSMNRLRDLVRSQPKHGFELPAWLDRLFSVGIVTSTRKSEDASGSPMSPPTRLWRMPGSISHSPLGSSIASVWRQHGSDHASVIDHGRPSVHCVDTWSTAVSTYISRLLGQCYSCLESCTLA